MNSDLLSNKKVIRRNFLASGKTLKEISFESGLSQNTLSRLMNHDRRNISYGSAQKIMRVFGADSVIDTAVDTT